MSWFCPRCRIELAPVGEVCPEHGLYGITADALTRAEDAPLLGYVLDARFVLIDYLGGGGMGAVYKGRQLSLDRVVAIKVLHASLTATREDRKRFEEEARALSLLQSPHAVTLYDFGVVRDGPLAHMAFMVLEFVEGETLAQRARGGALPAEAVAALLDDVADALDEAHAHGIVHRDLKPANIILSQDHRGNAVVKVIDFGVASFGGRTGLTRTGFSVGTPSYMAPEQFDADGSALVDGRADVYSMGVVAFTALTGQKPFASNSVLELARLHRQAAPPRVPGAEQGGRWAALEQVLHCALAKEPGARFSTMGAFAHAFRDALAVPEDVVMETMRVTVATPIVVGPVESVPTPTESFVGALELAGRPPRRRGWLSLAVTLAVCGAGGGGLALWLTARDAPSPAAEPPLVAEVGGVSEGALPVERIEAVVAVPKGVVSEAPVSAAPVSAASRCRRPRCRRPRCRRRRWSRSPWSPCPCRWSRSSPCRWSRSPWRPWSPPSPGRCRVSGRLIRGWRRWPVPSRRPWGAAPAARPRAPSRRCGAWTVGSRSPAASSAGSAAVWCPTWTRPAGTGRSYPLDFIDVSAGGEPGGSPERGGDPRSAGP
jgi:serine/threonine protein kinase